MVSDWLAIATLPNPQTRIMAGPCWVLMWLAVALNRYPADPGEVCGCDTQLLVMLCWLINWLRFVVIGGQSLARLFFVRAVSLSAATLAVLCTLLCWLIRRPLHDSRDMRGILVYMSNLQTLPRGRLGISWENIVTFQGMNHGRHHRTSQSFSQGAGSMRESDIDLRPLSLSGAISASRYWMSHVIVRCV